MAAAAAAAAAVSMTVPSSTSYPYSSIAAAVVLPRKLGRGRALTPASSLALVTADPEALDPKDDVSMAKSSVDGVLDEVPAMARRVQRAAAATTLAKLSKQRASLDKENAALNDLPAKDEAERRQANAQALQENEGEMKQAEAACAALVDAFTKDPSSLSPGVAALFQALDESGCTTFVVDACCHPAEAVYSQRPTEYPWMEKAEALLALFLKHLDRERGAEASTKVRIISRVMPPVSLEAEAIAAQVEAGVERSLAALGDLSSLDGVLLHWHDYDEDNGGYLRALGVLKRLCAEGKVKEFGLVGCGSGHLQRALDAGIPISIVQVRFSLLEQDAKRNGLLALCAKRGIRVFCQDADGAGLLSEAYLGKVLPGMEGGRTLDLANPEDVAVSSVLRSVEREGGAEVFQALLAVLNRLASSQGVTIADVALAWVRAHPACHPMQMAGLGLASSSKDSGSSADKSGGAVLSVQLCEVDMKAIDDVSTGEQSGRS